MSRILDTATILSSASRNMSVTSENQRNSSYTGVHLNVNLSFQDGTLDVTVSIQGLDETSGEWYNILEGPMVGTSTVFRIGLGLIPLAGTTANDFLPETWRVSMTHNNATNLIYSVGANLVKV